MDVWEYDGRLFEVEVATAVDRDGVSLELTALDDSPGVGPVLEVVRRDAGAELDLVVHRPTALPAALVERFVGEARKRIPPVDREV